jgi:NADH-quinone oxidoreductase subunit M
LIERRKSTAIGDYGGVAHVTPWLSAAFLIATLASAGLPMLNSFVGEYLILQGAAQANFTYAVFAAVAVILSACYLLWLYQRLFYGAKPERAYPDLDVREWLCVVPLVAMMFWLGIGAQTFLPAITSTTARSLEDSNRSIPARVEVRPGSLLPVLSTEARGAR